MINKISSETPLNLKKRDSILDAVKGLLILFIVLEHNTLLTAEYSWIRPFSDAFAAGCFLIMTFIWPLKPMPLKSFLNKYFSYWVPFFFFVSATTIANALLFSADEITIIAKNYLQAILLASPMSLKISTGLMYLWFLPCLSFLYLIRLCHQYIGHGFLIIAIACFFLLGELSEYLLATTPFSLHVIGFIYIIGVIYAKLHPYFMSANTLIKTLITLIFIILIGFSSEIGRQLLLAAGIMPSWQQPYLLLYYSSVMVLAIPGLYFSLSIMPKVLVNFTAVLGQESMKIYLIHPIIFILITKFIPISSKPVFSFIITVLISLIISMIITRLPIIHDLVFPGRVVNLSFKKTER